MGTQSFCLVLGHAGLDPKSPRLVRGGGNHRSLIGADNRNRLPSQRRIDLLLNRGKEGVHIYVYDGSFHSNHIDRQTRINKQKGN